MLRKAPLEQEADAIQILLLQGPPPHGLTRLAGRPELAGPESSFLQQPLSVIVAAAAGAADDR